MSQKLVQIFLNHHLLLVIVNLGTHYVQSIQHRQVVKREIAQTILMLVKSLMTLIVKHGNLIVELILQITFVKQVALQHLGLLHLILQIVKIGILCVQLIVTIQIVKKEVVLILNLHPTLILHVQIGYQLALIMEIQDVKTEHVITIQLIYYYTLLALVKLGCQPVLIIRHKVVWLKHVIIILVVLVIAIVSLIYPIV